jgi:hypothetical protein
MSREGTEIARDAVAAAPKGGETTIFEEVLVP